MAVISNYIQKKAIFRPVKLPSDHQFEFDTPYEEIYLNTPGKNWINGLIFKTSSKPSKGIVLYFHGNKDNLQRWGAFHSDFIQLGWDFFAIDYRGYGKSTGDPDEEGLYEDGLTAYQYIQKYYTADRIVLYGRSLGSAVATHLAANVPAKMLILETPFDNVKGLLQSHIQSISIDPAFIFPNDENVQKTTIPIAIFHGTKDHVVPYASAENLKKYLKPSDLFVIVEGGGHNNLRNFPQYTAILQQIL